MNKGAGTQMAEKIFVAGHRGMVGSAIVRLLRAQGRNILTVDRSILDLRRQTEVEFWLRANQPTAIIFAAAKVGGIFANSAYPADFIYDNLTIQTNVIHGAHKAGVDRLVFLGSSCIYPKFAPQPIKEDALMTGPLEPTNRMVRDCQNLRDHDLPGLPPSTWPALHFGHALQSLWAKRQF